VADDQLDQLITGDKCQDNSGNRHDDILRECPDHGKHARLEIRRRLTYLCGNFPDLVIYHVKGMGQGIHNDRNQQGFQPFPKLVEYFFQCLSPFREPQDRLRFFFCFIGSPCSCQVTFSFDPSAGPGLPFFRKVLKGAVQGLCRSGLLRRLP